MTTIIAGTGHRPEKLLGYNMFGHMNLKTFAFNFLKEMEDIEIISGMSAGWDLALANAAYNLSIPFTAAVPFDGQDECWFDFERDIYQKLLMDAKKVVIVSPGPYAMWKYHARNEWMVNNCDELLALWNGTKGGGTAATIRYATNKRPITNVWDEFLVFKKTLQ